jgi:hypothetical protein
VLLPDTVLMINMVIIKLALEVKQVQKSILLNVEAGVQKISRFLAKLERTLDFVMSHSHQIKF